MSFYENNIEKLLIQNPILVQRMEEMNCENIAENSACVTEEARDGSFILGMVRNGKKVMLNSTYRPNEESKKYAEKICLTENSITVFMGLGNGIIPLEILGKLNKEAALIIYEPSKELFSYVMKHFDLTELLGDERVAVFVEGINEELLENNLGFHLTNMNVGVTILEHHPKYKDLFPAEKEKLDKVFKDCRDVAITNLSTVIEHSKLMTQNAILNLRILLKSKIASDFLDKFPKDLPIIIVSGGPSLDKNYKVLKQINNNAVIVAMDRTAKFLLNHGIRPNMFCSLDFSKNIELFRDERLQDIPFLYIPDLRHEALKVVDGRQYIFGGGSYKFYDWILKRQGKMPVDIPYGGSVATFAFSFATYVRSRKIILVGQDLALTGGKTYAGNMQNARSGAELMDRPMVPGNVEAMVESRGDFYTYLLWFQQAIRELSDDVEVINATEGGARIEGTTIMPLQEAVDRYCQKKYDINKIFDSVEPLYNRETIGEAYQMLEQKGKELIKIKDTVKNSLRAAERCYTLVERGDLSKEFKMLNKELSKTGKIFDENDVVDFVNKYVEHLLIQTDMDLYVTEDDNWKEMQRLYGKLKNDYHVIYDNIDAVIALYQKMLKDICQEYEIVKR